MLSKQNRKIIFTIIIFFFSLITYIFPKLPTTCKDCGSIDNCLYGNGLTEGYLTCVLVGTEYGIGCQVYNWCGN
jgi:hypothetical protein